jgi:hypothetical protein
MGYGYALAAKRRWPKIADNIGTLQHYRGATPHAVTYPNEHGRPRLRERVASLPYHIVSLPTRAHREASIKPDDLSATIRRLAILCDEAVSWLKEGFIVLPQICDKGRSWEQFRIFVDPWLSDRYIAISGKVGTPT